jgi:hypothetical protein
VPPGDIRNYKWLTIEDFTPGIITNLQMVYPVNTGASRGVPGKQLGQAQAAVGCIALPNGGLAPLPGIYTPPWNGGSPVIPPLHGLGTENMIAGFFVGGKIFDNGVNGGFASDELIVNQMNFDGTTANFWLDSYRVSNIGSGGTGVNNIYANTGAAIGTPVWTTMTGGLTRANAVATDVGNPCWAVEFWFRAGSGQGSKCMFLYPDPTNYGTGGFVPYQLYGGTPAGGIPGPFILHQNRIIQAELFGALWGSSQRDWWTAELLNYTDPPNGVAFGIQQEVFVQEDPSGYAAWGSQSASELFLVKNEGGGVVISGDLNSPTVTALPGVTPTAGIACRGASTPIGFVYAVNERGLWVWNGSNTSQKISNQLDDASFTPGEGFGLHPLFAGPSVQIIQWGDWILASNDWLYDTNTGGWWQLPPGHEQSPHIWYGTSYDGDKLYACLPIPTTNSMIDMYARSTPSTSYTWTSYPMRPPDVGKDKMLVAREVVVRAMGDGIVEIGVFSDAFSPTYSPSNILTFETTQDNSTPSMQLITGGVPAQDIVISIFSEAASTGPAPIVYSVAIGYEELDAMVSAP